MVPNPTLADESLPSLTPELPGIGGVIKRYNEDFWVEEVPLYPASGQGTHTYFVIEKQGLTTLAAIRLIAQALGRPPRDIGYAGLKDAHGVTRQMLSIEHVDPQRVASLQISRIRVLSVNRHTNKLKLGHHAGNRFQIKIRDGGPDAFPRARTILERLLRRGVPNYFGPQRFGARGDNALVGKAVLCEDYAEAVALILGRPGPHDHGKVRAARERFDQGDYQGALLAWPPAFREQLRVAREMVRTSGDAVRAWQAVDHTLRRLYASAFQSALFNQVVSRRIEALDRVETGDLAWKHSNGACFHVLDAAAEQPRCDAFEISATGPLFGPRMTEATGRPGRIEAEVLLESGVTRAQIQTRHSRSIDGARRPLRVPLAHTAVESGEDERGSFLLLTFTLPPGAYATNVTREVIKEPVADCPPSSAPGPARAGRSEPAGLPRPH
jgi:tRNA pseudouridine13 synthase